MKIGIAAADRSAATVPNAITRVSVTVANLNCKYENEDSY